jgi:SAM-dependent methyltransferase
MSDAKIRLASPSSSVDGRQTLNLGCGLKHVPDAINLDLTAETHPDVVHDLSRFPWPFPAQRFSGVLAFDVIEHLDDFIATMEEIHRVAQEKALVRITVPHFSCANAFTDPTHRRLFGYFSFDYLTGESEIEHYTRVRFSKRYCRLIFYPSLLNRLIGRLANRYPAAYERRWTWIFPAWYLYLELEVQKD